MHDLQNFSVSFTEFTRPKLSFYLLSAHVTSRSRRRRAAAGLPLRQAHGDLGSRRHPTPEPATSGDQHHQHTEQQLGAAAVPRGADRDAGVGTRADPAGSRAMRLQKALFLT